MSMSKPINSKLTLITSQHSETETTSPVLTQPQTQSPDQMINEDDNFYQNVFKHDSPYRNDSNDDSLSEFYANPYPNEQRMDLQPFVEEEGAMDFSMMQLGLEDQVNDQLRKMEIGSDQENSHEDLSDSFDVLEFSVNSQSQTSIKATSEQSEQSTSPSSSLSSSSSSSGSQRNLTSNRDHLKGQRRPKGSIIGQYPTKNLLPAAKKIHSDYILEKKGEDYIKNDPKLKAIFNHTSAVRNEFEILYKYPDLTKLWEVFFQKKVIYREIMLAKAKTENKVKYLQFLDSFEYAFLTGRFIRLTVCRSDELRMLKSQRHRAQ